LRRFLLLLVLLLAVASTLPVRSAAQESVGGEPVSRATLFYDGRSLIELRGISALPARERVQLIRDRLIAAAEDPAFDPAELTLEPVENGIRIASPTHLLMVVYDADARIEEIETPILATAIRERLRAAIADYRADRTPQGLRAAWRTAGFWTLGYMTLIATFVLLSRFVGRVIDRYVDARIGHWEARARNVVQLKAMWRTIRRLLHYGFVALALLSTYIWLNGVLLALPPTRETGREALALVADPIRRILAGIVASIPDLIAIALIVGITWYVLRIAGRFFGMIGTGRLRFRNFDPEWSLPTERIVRILIVLFAAIMAYPYIPGSSSEAFRAISIFAGVMFSLGATSIVANLIAGHSLIYRRAFRVGDRIEVAGVFGDVEEMTAQATYIRTLKNERVTVPNALVLGSQVTNYSQLARREGLILHTEVGIGYEVSWQQVEEMLLEAARRTEGALRDPAPFVLQKKLGDYSPVYEINIYTRDEKAMPETYTRLHAAIQDVFAERGVQIMTPSYVADPPEAKVPPRAVPQVREAG
jgi:small-conductance mechanosensitive channel